MRGVCVWEDERGVEEDGVRKGEGGRGKVGRGMRRGGRGWGWGGCRGEGEQTMHLLQLIILLKL